VRPTLAIALAALAAATTPATASAGLSRSDRAGIDATLDVFVPSAVTRVHPERAWALATAAMHTGGTKAGWARGEVPVPPFPAAGKTFHDWTVDSLRPGAADLVLLLHPRPRSALGAVSYDVGMRKAHGRWLVNSFVPAASFAPAGSISGITASPDLGPGSATPAYSKRGRISGTWLLAIPAVLVGLIVLIPTVLFAVSRTRSRRAARRYASETRVV
jgi:hypothetical protein